MKSKLIISVVFVGLAASLLAADDQAPTGVIHIDQSKVTAAFASGGPILLTNEFKVQTGRRTGPGEAELHDRDTDIFYILEGSALFVTGGKLVDTKIIGSGETRARAIAGGEENRLTKGDVIMIPRGIPHWFKEVNGTLVYYVVKVTK